MQSDPRTSPLRRHNGSNPSDSPTAGALRNALNALCRAILPVTHDQGGNINLAIMPASAVEREIEVGVAKVAECRDEGRRRAVTGRHTWNLQILISMHL